MITQLEPEDQLGNILFLGGREICRLRKHSHHFLSDRVAGGPSFRGASRPPPLPNIIHNQWAILKDTCISTGQSGSNHWLILIVYRYESA